MKVRKGFTMIELLVVIAVITILMQMLAPSLKHAYDEAIRLSCRSNIKAQVMASLQYMFDNHDRLWPGLGLGYGIMGYRSRNGKDGAVLNMAPFYEYLTGEPCVDKDGNPKAPPRFFAEVAKGADAGLSPLMICPNNKHPDNYDDIGRTSRWSYGNYLYSARDLAVNSRRAMKVYKYYMNNSATHDMGGAGAPALWGDRIIYKSGTNAGTLGETNHDPDNPPGTAGVGGNVGNLDGSVLWFNSQGDQKKSWNQNGAKMPGIAIPSNGVGLTLDDNGNSNGTYYFQHGNADRTRWQ